MSLWRTNGDLPYHQAVNNAERASAVPTTTMLLKYINEHKSDAINILDNKRQTALHIASYKVVNVLLQGVDHIKVDGKDSSGMAPMDSAVQAAAYTMVLLLQSYFEATGLYGPSRHICQCCQCNSCGCSITCIWHRYPIFRFTYLGCDWATLGDLTMSYNVFSDTG